MTTMGPFRSGCTGLEDGNEPSKARPRGTCGCVSQMLGYDVDRPRLLRSAWPD
jgi:hypothetical protein